MNLRGLVSVTGKPGLFRLIGQNKSGFVIETLDKQQVRQIVNMSTAKMATLEDITIFGEEDEIKLIDIFQKMKDSDISIPDPKAGGPVLRNFFIEIAPDHDQTQVYTSDIKKIISWYGIIKEFPLFEEPEPEPLVAAEE